NFFFSLWHLCCSEVSISPLFRWPNSVNHFTPNKRAIKEVIESAEAVAAEILARGETPPAELLNPVPGAHLERGERSLRIR
ncbi:hypothetical protein ACVQHJ_22300, partial [Escherichia coli]